MGRFVLVVAMGLLVNSGVTAQTLGTGFTLVDTIDLGGSGFNNVDSSAGVHMITNRNDNGERIDMDNDGNYEFVVMAKNTLDNVFIFEANGDDTYVQRWGFDPNSGTGSVPLQAAAVADSDGDGNLELIHSDGSTVRVFEYSGAGQITDGSNPSDTPVGTFAISAVMGMTVGNLDGDGFQEIIVCSTDEVDALSIIEATGNNSWAGAQTGDVGNDDGMDNDTDGGCASMSNVADLDGDATMELVVAPDEEARTLDAFFVYTWNGATITEEARLGIAAHVSGTPGINNVLVYDIDGVGNPEIVLTENEFHGVYVYESTVANTYSADAGAQTPIRNNVNNTFHPAVGDFDADGNLEIYLPVDDGLGSESAIYVEHNGVAGGFAAGNFGSAVEFISDLEDNGPGGSNDPRGVAYAQGSLDGGNMGDIVLISQNGDVFIVEANAASSQVPVELQSFAID